MRGLGAGETFWMKHLALACGLAGLLAFCAPSAPLRAQPAQNPPAPAATPVQKIVIGYLRRAEDRPYISRLEKEAKNDGVAGAQAGVDDDNVTGSFMGQKFNLVSIRLKHGEEAATALKQLTDKGVKFILADLPAKALLDAADSPAAAKTLIFNVGATDDSLRQQDCRANVIHVAPTRAMLADGLAQYLIWKKWSKWFLVVGSHRADQLWADALKRSAKRFGATIVGQRVFKDRGGARESDSGIALVQKQIPVFTQSTPDYDVLVAADESSVFAEYLPYRTWLPRPVAGSAGLVPTSWAPSMENWGATQMQDRFEREFSRRMTALDMQAWTAARMIGNAAESNAFSNAATMKAFFLSKKFVLGAYKGQRLTLRDWNLQLRQPILLSDGRNIVSISPQAGFLHQYTTLDTLGFDRPETKCHFK